MGKQTKRQSFADMVREVEEQPLPPAPDRSGVVDPGGKRWHHQTDEVSPARALELAKAGASVAWDPCGCGGFCGFDWYGVEDVARMVTSGMPTVRSSKKHTGSISEWTTDDGDVLVVAENEVQWGGVING